MLGAWSSETLQAYLEAGVVALADALELAACCPSFVAWFATSELALSKLKCWWWRRVGIVVVVLVGTTVASVGHLMTVNSCEIEVKDRDIGFPSICIKV
jgi:amino acid permease